MAGKAGLGKLAAGRKVLLQNFVFGVIGCIPELLGFGGLLGIPLDIQITLNQDQCPPEAPGQAIPLPVDVLLNLGYSQDEVDRLGLDEQSQLAILHYTSGWATWQQLGVNDDLNWITASTQEDGIFAIGWQP